MSPQDFDKAGRELPRKPMGPGGEPTIYDNLDRYIKTSRLISLSAIRRQFDELSKPCWVFRGQANSRWGLTTSLERITGARLSYQDAEMRLLDTFRRRAHLYAPDVPAADDDLAWVGVMQHHGGPTRLLDFTTSPWVALYFAIEDVQPSKSCAVWAVNRLGCDQRAIHRIEALQEWHHGTLLTTEELLRVDVAQLLSRPRLFRKAFLENRFVFVCTVQPLRDNLRLAMQQGLFLCPGDLRISFERNLLEQLIMGKDPDYFVPVWNPPQLYRFIIPGGLRCELLRDLKRMNINRASLFPGLDGFAQSLRFDLLQDI